MKTIITTAKDKVLQDFQTNGFVTNDDYQEQGIRRLGAIICYLKKEGYRFESYYECDMGLSNKRNCYYIMTNPMTNPMKLKMTKTAMNNIKKYILRANKYNCINYQDESRRR